MITKALVPNIWYESINPRVLLLQASHLGIFDIIFFLWDVSNSEILRLLRKHIKVPLVKISGFGSLYFWRYSPRKIGFLTHLEFSFKRAILGFSL
jgi:hypothetical protein